MLLFDNETDIDFLYYESIAETILSIVSESKETPITIGVHGDWGAGKSSILKMIEKKLEKEEKIVCLKFNGWLFQGFEDAKIVLIESIINSLQTNKKITAKICDQINSLLKRVKWLKLAKLGGGIAYNIATGTPAQHQITDAASFLNNLKDKNNLEEIKKGISDAASILKPADPKTIPSEMHCFREEFEKLLKDADIDQLVVLVDDLDRCLPETAIETLEAIRLFLLVPKTSFIIAADEGMIECAVKKHFPYIPNYHGLNDYAKNYLEKLIQIPFRIPALGGSETRTYLTLSLIQQHLEDPIFNNILDKSRELLQKPWDNSGLSRQDIENIIGEMDAELDEVIFLSEQISPILNEGTKGNPRQIKRFINSLLLRFEISRHRNLNKFINKKTLAKLMLLESFKPDIYDFIAADSAKSVDGICQDIKQVEESVKNTSEISWTENLSKFKTEDEWFKKWLKIQPSIGEEDLRPYVFIAKDKKINLFLINTNEKILELFNVLLQSKFMINANINKIKNITESEALELFNLVTNRIKEHKDWTVEPAGYEGIKALVQEHSSLQKHFISLLKTFDGNNIGVWVLNYDDMNLNLEIRKEVIELITEWQKTNKFLQAGNLGGE